MMSDDLAREDRRKNTILTSLYTSTPRSRRSGLLGIPQGLHHDRKLNPNPALPHHDAKRNETTSALTHLEDETGVESHRTSAPPTWTERAVMLEMFLHRRSGETLAQSWQQQPGSQTLA
ncbi:hypothetical protein VTI74DRAFT_10710 [Chaetomium olivicolor]